MVKQKIYPNYTDNYYYNSGDSYIQLKRTKTPYGGKANYEHTMNFDSPEEAEKYFNENCGG